jgi:hypothetical protein
MARFASQNLASFGTAPQAGNGDGKRRFCYGKQRNVIIVGGKKMLDDGLCLRLLPTYAADENGRRITNANGNPVLSQFHEDDGFGDWCRTYECVSWFGQPALHFIVWDGNPAVNRYESPVWLLYRAAYKNKETPGIGQLFCDLLNRQAGFQQQTHVGSLKRPEQILFVSATQLYNKPDRTPGFGCFDLADQKENNARIFGFKKTAAESLLNALKMQDNAGNYLSGDMLSPNSAKLVTVISKSYGAALNPKPPRPVALSNEGPEYLYVPPYAVTTNTQETIIVGKPNPSPDGKTSGEQHWVILHNTFNGRDVAFGNYSNKIITNNNTFDEFMHVPSFEEQADLMADAFPREALDFAWRDHPEYIRYIRRGTTTVAAPQAMAAEQPVVPNAAAYPSYPGSHAGPGYSVEQQSGINDEIDPAIAAEFDSLTAAVSNKTSNSQFPDIEAKEFHDIVAEARARARAAIAAQQRG